MRIIPIFPAADTLYQIIQRLQFFPFHHQSSVISFHTEGQAIEIAALKKDEDYTIALLQVLDEIGSEFSTLFMFPAS